MTYELKTASKYAFLTIFSIIMIYPLIWLFFACFKTNAEIFGNINLFPSKYSFEAFVKGWNGTGQYSFATYFINTIILVVPNVLFTIVSSSVVAYGFARFNFPFKKILFTLMISTLMLPNAVLIIPRYMIFRNFGWLDSYLPFLVPSALACNAFFIFMMVQFFRGLPKELDESAYIDGCNSFTILIKILLPLCKPALFSVGIFQFIWTWNDFFNQLIYINSVQKYTISLGLRMSLDTLSVVNWNQIMALSLIAILPCVLVFFLAQKYFVEGIATTGIKG